MRTRCLVPLLTLLWCTVGCTRDFWVRMQGRTIQFNGQGFALPTLRFPPRAWMAAMAASTPPGADAPVVASIDQWTLRGEYPPTLGEVLPSTDASTPLLDGLFPATGPRAARSRAMRCFALESVHFERARARSPGAVPSWLGQIMRQRCGVTGAELRIAGYSLTASPGETDEALSARLVQRTRADAEALIPPTETREVGAAFAREGDVGFLVAAAANPRARLAPSPRSPDSQGAVQISGRLTVPLATLSASVTAGPLGVRACVVDPSVPLPGFRAVCPVAAGVDDAMVSIWGREAAVLLNQPVLSVAVGAPERFGTHVERPRSVGAQRTVPEHQAALVAALNEARGRAGLLPLLISEEQSREVCSVAPHLFAAAEGRFPRVYESQIASGLIAGWAMNEPIVDAGLYMQHGSLDGPEQALNEHLRSAFGRGVLLGRSWERVAVCPILDTSGRVDSVVWTFFDVVRPDGRAVDTSALRERILVARAQAQMPPIAIDEQLCRASERAVEKLMQGQVDAQGAMAEVMYDARTGHDPSSFISVGRSGVVRSWWVVGSEVSELAMPDELTYRPYESVGGAIAHVRIPGSSWAVRVALIVAVEASP
jgi:hypothetical protein